MYWVKGNEIGVGTKQTFRVLPLSFLIISNVHFWLNYIQITISTKHILEERLKFSVFRDERACDCIKPDNNLGIVEASFHSEEGTGISDFLRQQHIPIVIRGNLVLLRQRSSKEDCSLVQEWKAASVNLQGYAGKGRCLWWFSEVSLAIRGPIPRPARRAVRAVGECRSSRTSAGTRLSTSGSLQVVVGHGVVGK